MVSMTSRQVAPFQALLNMIKINYLGKSEVFKVLIAVLCDYEPNNCKNVSKSLRYIRVLLTGNPDLAECLISFLPPPISPSDSDHPKDAASKTQPNDVPGISRPHAHPTNYQIYPHDIKPVISSKDSPCSWCAPAVKKSFPSTGFTITASIRDGRMVTASEYGHDETSPHPRPLMVPHPGGAANHLHVLSESEHETMSIKPEPAGITLSPFPVPLVSSEYLVGSHGPLVTSQTEERTALDLSVRGYRGVPDPWVKPYDAGVTVHPLLKSTTTPIKDDLVTKALHSIVNHRDDSNNLMVNNRCLSHDTPPQRRNSPAVAPSMPLAVGLIPSCTKAFQHGTLHASQVSSSLVNQPVPLNKPIGITIPLSNLLHQGIGTLTAANPALSQLLSMSKVSSTSTVQQLQKHFQSSVSDGQLSGPPGKVPRLESFRPGRELESLKELTTKLKVAERTLKQSQQYAKMIRPVISNQYPVDFSVSGIPVNLMDPKENNLDQGTSRNLTSFPYIQRIILPDGDVRTLNIDSSAGKSSCDRQNQLNGYSIPADDGASEQRKKKKHKLKKVKRKVNSENQSV